MCNSSNSLFQTKVRCTYFNNQCHDGNVFMSFWIFVQVPLDAVLYNLLTSWLQSICKYKYFVLMLIPLCISYLYQYQLFRDCGVVSWLEHCKKTIILEITYNIYVTSILRTDVKLTVLNLNRGFIGNWLKQTNVLPIVWYKYVVKRH